MGNEDVYSPEYGIVMSEIMRNKKKPSKIEKIITITDYKNAKKVVERYKSQLRKEIKDEQKNCNHNSYYRYWYSEDHLINTCRNCFHEWEEKDRPFLLEEYNKLTSGKFEMTEKDRENGRKYQERLSNIDKL